MPTNKWPCSVTNALVTKAAQAIANIAEAQRTSTPIRKKVMTDEAIDTLAVSCLP